MTKAGSFIGFTHLVESGPAWLDRLSDSHSFISAELFTEKAGIFWPSDARL